MSSTKERLLRIFPSILKYFRFACTMALSNHSLAYDMKSLRLLQIGICIKIKIRVLTVQVHFFVPGLDSLFHRICWKALVLKLCLQCWTSFDVNSFIWNDVTIYKKETNQRCIMTFSSHWRIQTSSPRKRFGVVFFLV